MLRKRRNPKKCCPSNQTNGAKQLGCQTYYRPPALSVISVSSVVISYTPEFPAAPGEQTFDHGFHGCRPDSESGDRGIRFSGEKTVWRRPIWRECFAS